MNKQQYICLNGLKIKADEPVISASNRAFRYGDAIFETIRCIQQEALFFEDHYRRLLNAMAQLKMNCHSLPPLDVLNSQISSLISKNRIFGDARIRLTVFREDGGLYTPEGNNTNYLIEATPLNTNNYTLNSKGILLDVYKEDKKPTTRFSRFKSANSLLFVMAGLYKKEQNLDDVLIVNDQNLIIESLASNLYWIKDQVVYTPSRTSGCVEGIMRAQLIEIMKQADWQVQEVAGASLDELLAADELFLSNAIQGIQWVVGIQQKRYFCQLSKKLNLLLNEHVTNYLMDSQGN
ncbi:aminotransferase class IV [Carboxylicivirga sp. N1Y90]|uniref:aminotransferase class IV n=1 Tax=Carboxylicivirga fragile TaxID=3417571 RepID=UPI003D35330E|nr:aminotransferase class IV [Marinilabiliaceae bacterium N1Y90]